MKKMKVLMSDVVDLIDQNADIKGIVVHGKEFIRVVRCNDCIYQAECAFTEWLGRNGNGFCSSGERR